MILEYNSFMGGGVDLSDTLCALYRISFKSHKWYTPIFAYLLDVALINAWLLYKDHHKQKAACLKKFLIMVAEELKSYKRPSKTSRSPMSTLSEIIGNGLKAKNTASKSIKPAFPKSINKTVMMY